LPVHHDGHKAEVNSWQKGKEKEFNEREKKPLLDELGSAQKWTVYVARGGFKRLTDNV